MSLRRYALLVLGILAVSLAGGGALLGDRLGARGARAALFGAAVAALNALLAHVLVLRAEGRPPAVFIKLVLGGMAGRMALVLGAVAVGVAVLRMPPLPLVVSLLGHFTVFLGLEILALNASPRASTAGAR